ncbi:hypothetical protein DYB26_000047 [Aphanomyces astaci]|uniref:Uncharacterized protein n=1 Tax=Aphanomyces astaci TaxID=112090 RepID=A0A418FDF0_APHAT|nr:hypothetical protein DYB26_000047 [Aphanomyces astaci]
MSALEVTLGDMVDTSRKAANDFLLARQPLLSPTTFIAHIEGWLEQLVTTEITAFEARDAALNLYFYQIETLAIGQGDNTKAIPAPLRPLIDALGHCMSSNPHFGALLAPLASLCAPRPSSSRGEPSATPAPVAPQFLSDTTSSTTQPSTTDNQNSVTSTPSPPQLTDDSDNISARRLRIMWRERALVIQRVLAAIDFVTQLIRRVEPVDETERQALGNVTVEYMRQDHSFIQQVLSDLAHLQPSIGPTAKVVAWPRRQGLETPWIRHSVDISAHRNYLHPRHVLVVAKALASAPEQTDGLIELSIFSRIVRDTALVREDDAGVGVSTRATKCSDEMPSFPEFWINFARVSHAALPFCTASHLVDWRRFLLSVLFVQWVPPPRTKHLHALLSPRTHIHDDATTSSGSLADAYWTQSAFASLPMWLDNVVDQPEVFKDCLYHIFALQDTRVPVATFVLHLCVSTYPTDVVSALHGSLAPFSRGLARAFRFLLATPSSSSPPSWDASKFRLLLSVSHVADVDIIKVVDGYDYSVTDVESFLHYCDATIPSLAARWAFHNVYDNLVE